MKIKQINKNSIPSLFTLINLFLGFLAILSITDGFYVRASYLIVGAAIFDAIDGKLARKFHALSQFGLEFDSLADVVSFCLAPSLLVWSIYARDLHPVLGALIAGAPLYFGAIRLARFNVIQTRWPSNQFIGLPSPVSAFAVISLVLYYYQPGISSGPAKVILPVVLATSFLMVSRIRYAKFPNFNLHSGPANTFKLLVLAAAGTGLALFGGRALLPFTLLYILSGIIRWLTRVDAAIDLHSADTKV